MNDSALPDESASTQSRDSQGFYYRDAGGAAGPLMIWLATVGGWFVPGFGHLLLRRWGRAVVVFLCIGGMAMAGYKLQGQVFSIRSDDIFAILGHLAEVGGGAFYFFSHVLEPGGVNVAQANGDIGTRLLAMAGLLNFLSVADVFEIARHGKP